MSDNQHFCLKWNNHQSTLVSLFPSLLDTNTFVDCTLAAGGKQLQAHKVVLSACSPYFKELLVQHNDKHPIIILYNLDYNELVAIVDFMYKGEVNISQDHLGDFLKLAKALQIKGLTDHKSGDEDPEDDSKKEEEPTGDGKDSAEILSNSGNFSDNSSNLSTIVKKEKWDEESQEIDCDDYDEEEIKEINNTSWFPYKMSFSSLASEMNINKSFNESSRNQSLVTNSMEFLQRVFPRQSRKSHPGEATFACETCQKRYRSKTSLNLHRRWECGKEPRFKCPFCEKRTHQKGNLKVHIMSRHRDYVSSSQTTIT